MSSCGSSRWIVSGVGENNIWFNQLPHAVSVLRPFWMCVLFLCIHRKFLQEMKALKKEKEKKTALGKSQKLLTNVWFAVLVLTFTCQKSWHGKCSISPTVHVHSDENLWVVLFFRSQGYETNTYRWKFCEKSEKKTKICFCLFLRKGSRNDTYRESKKHFIIWFLNKLY